jgi:hypothetical protein
MNLALTEEQDAVRGLARQIFDGSLTPDRLKEVEASPEWFDRALWKELARANLLGIAIPEEFGGSGHGIIELCLLLEEVGRAVAPVPALATLVMGALPLARFGSPEQQRRFLPGIAEGRVIATAAVPADAPAVDARQSEAGWTLHGVAHHVPSAHLAACVLVAARTPDGSLGVFLADPEAAAVERYVVTSHEPHFTLSFDGATAELLAGAECLAWMRNHTLIGICATHTGIAERALRLTAEYTATREQFGRPLGSFQAVQQRAADSYIDVESMRWTMWQAAWRLSEELPADEEVAIAKFWAADAGQRVAAASQHLHGGIGVDISYPLHRYTLWSKQLELTLGGATQHLARLGDLLAECDT